MSRPHSLCALALVAVACNSQASVGRPPAARVAGVAATVNPSMPQPVRILLYAGIGAWPEGLRALRETYQTGGLNVVQTSGGGAQLSPQLDVADAVVIGGGWAPDQTKGFGEAGLRRLKHYVQSGGGYVGICAGAYLASQTVRWENQSYQYPLALFNGTAEGPRPGLVPWPNSGFVTVTRVEGVNPLQAAGSLQVLYFGGSSFLPPPSTQQGAATALLRYPDGSVAAIAFDHGRGRVALLGPHLEVRDPERPAESEKARELLRAATLYVARR